MTRVRLGLDGESTKLDRNRGRPFSDDRAVAAAVAVALLIMVVVLVSVAATVVFNRVTANSSDTGMRVAFLSEDAVDRLKVVTSQPDGDWARVAARLVRMDSSGFGLCIGSAEDLSPTLYVNEPPGQSCMSGPNRMTVAGRELVQFAAVPTKIHATDFVAICSQEPATNVRLQLVDLGASMNLGEYNFNQVNACA